MSKRLSAPCLLVSCFLLLSALPAAAQETGASRPIVIPDSYHDTSLPLWEMAVPAVPHHGPPRSIGILRGNVGPQLTLERPDPVGQTVSPNAPVPTTDLLNFDGQKADGVAPPDTEGSVGATQYVQWVNVEYNVYNKTTGAKILGPIAGNSIWVGFPGPCGSNNSGDPIVRYDAVAGRWLFAQNVFTPPYTACIAVSTTSDATGTFNRYSFTLPNSSVNFPDYPKWGVWPDAYYTSVNVFANQITETNTTACAADRSKMLIGNPATLICIQGPSGKFNMLPADQDGLNPPPAGAPNHYIELASATGNLNKFDFHVDFTTPSLSTFTGPTLIATAAFTEICSNGTNRACIPQPAGGEKVDSLGDRLMYRNAYRNFGSYESLLDTHTVKPTTGTAVAATRWYELRSTPPGGAFSAFQQGTIQASPISLWMASIAQDKNGDIAIGMSAASSTIDPSIIYMGRLPTDALGTMEGFKPVVKGTGVQSANTFNRWGDYADMSVDPTDDCTFFFTEEYIKTSGAFNWSTRINSFKFNACQ